MSQRETSAADAGREEVGRNLEELRKSRGWSQTELAERMSDAGQAHFRQTTVSRIERGLQPLRLSDMEALSVVFGADAGRIWSDTVRGREKKKLIDSLILRDSRALIEEKIETIARELDELRELFGIYRDANQRNIDGGDDGQH